MVPTVPQPIAASEGMSRPIREKMTLTLHPGTWKKLLKTATIMIDIFYMYIWLVYVLSIIYFLIVMS